MKVDLLIKKLQEIKEKHGTGDYYIVALDEENNTYELTDIIYHEGLDIYGVKFE
jgi:hypothetical protein